MSIRIGSNIASLKAQRSLEDAFQGMARSLERLSSGFRLNRPSDDAAGISVADSLRASRRVYTQATRNVNDGISALGLADSTLSDLSTITTRIRELAQQASNGGLSTSQRRALDAEAQELSQEFFRISRASAFNGLRFFDGSFERGLRIQAGYGANGSIQSSLGGKLGNGAFESADSYSEGAPTSTALADLDNDGNLDRIEGSTIGGGVQVALGLGDGRFRPAQAVAALSSAEHRVEVADLNNDGILDLVTAGQHRLLAALGRGDGTFHSAWSSGALAVNSFTEAIGVGDFNNDGFLDLVGGIDDAKLLLYTGSGNGQFQASVTINLNAGGLNPLRVAIADFNADGNLDIVTSIDGNDPLISLGNGNGTFITPQSVGAGNSYYTVVAGDINNDGALDLVFGRRNTGEATAMLGNGDGTFRESATSFDFGTEEGELLLGDVNGDGALDIVISNASSDGVSVLLNRGDGGFNESVVFGTAIQASYAAALGDLNGDGVLDIVYGSDAVGGSEVLLGSTRDGVAPLLSFSLRTQADALQALAPLDRKLEQLAAQRGVIGAFQSRLQVALERAQNTAEISAAAESRIRDIDMASESASYTRIKILQETGSAILAQANQQATLALQLLTF